MTASPTLSFNLLHEPWLDVLDLTSSPATVSLGELLRNGHRYQRFNTSDPLERLVLTRFLVAVVAEIHTHHPDPDTWQAITIGDALPGDVVDGFVDRNKEVFDLFGARPFAQRAEFNSGTPDPWETLIAHIPSKSNAAWFNRDATTITAIAPAAAARALLLRFFAGTPGNESDGGGTRSKKSSPGGPLLNSIARSTHLWHEAGTLLATALINLPSNLVNDAPPGVLFWADPDGRRYDDQVWLMSASPVGSLLHVDSHGVGGVVRSPGMTQPEENKQLLDAAKLAEPFQIRLRNDTDKPDAPTTCKLISFEAVVSQYSMLHTLLDKVGDLDRIRPCALTNRRRSPYQAPSRTVAVTIEPTGSATGVRIAAVALFDFPDITTALPEDRVRITQKVLRRIGGSDRSLRTLTNHHVQTSYSSTRGAHDDSIRRRVARELWDQLDAHLAATLQTLNDTEHPDIDDLETSIRLHWRSTALNVFDDLTAPVARTATGTATVIQHRYNLSKSLTKELKL